MKMRTYVRMLLALLLLTPLVWAAEPTSRNPIPNPEMFLESDSFSIAVVQLRENSVPIQNLLKAALNSIATGEAKLPPSMAETSDYLARNNRADLLIAGLPYQAVRVDRMLAGGQSSPLIASTLSGWRGLQVNIYDGLAADDSGKAFPSTPYRRTDLVARTHASDPTFADNLCRVNGTFLFAPTPDAAKVVVDRLMPKEGTNPTPPPGDLLNAYRALSKSQDAYGVLINRGSAFSALLKSFNNEHIQKIRDKVGNDRLEKGVANTRSVVWQVNIVSEDRAEFQADLTVDPAQAAEIAAMFNDGKAALDTAKIADYAVTQAGGTVTVKCAVVGLKNLMLDSLAKGSIGI